MNVRRALVVLTLIVALPLPAMATNHGDPARGEKLAQGCRDCHGVGGENRIEGFPNLASQKYNYLIKQLREMRTTAKERYGQKTATSAAAKTLLRAKRTNEAMDPFVVDLSDEDIRDLSAYYSELPCDAVMTGAPVAPPRFEIRCQVCHGKFGIADNANVPSIAGQDIAYLENQLHSFKRAGAARIEGGDKRRAAIMEGQVRHLSEQDIKDISLYYGRLPCR